MKSIETTLLLLRDGNKIMLAKKKRGFGEGKYNGVGGKLEDNETVEEALLRETKEEVGIIPIDFEKVGTVSFDEYYKGEKEHLIFHLFKATSWEGELVETDEMKPCWFDIDKIPYNEMFPDDKYWMPYFIEDKKFDAYFKFDEDWNILDKDIKFN